jgi:hypothetical protein
LSEFEQVRQEWERLAAQGAYVFPLPPGGKNPGELGVKWKETWVSKGRNPFPQLAAVHFDDARGLWLATGQISKRVVLDIDKPGAGDYWRDKIGPEIFDAALRVNTGKGFHLHFAIPADDDSPWEGHSDNALGYDLRADGGGVVVPPSVHSSGRRYEWAGGELQPVPQALRHPSPRASQTGSNVVSLDGRRTRRQVESALTKALSTPPAAEGDGRNNWLASVSGHLARFWPVPMRDAFDQMVLHLGTTLDDPLDPGEAEKVAQSIWERERDRTQGQVNWFVPETGWLKGDGAKLFTQRLGSDGGKFVTEWADFDLVAQRVVQDADERVFYADVVTAHTTYPAEPIRAEVIGNIHRLNVWLAAHHISIVGHPADECKVAYGTRIMRYLLSQNPAVSQTAHHYGHQPDGTFLVPEGLLEGGGVAPHRDRVPAQHLSGWSKYRYGTVSETEAVGVLSEVLTFQDPVTASVFAAWWCMALLKGRYQSSLFPFMLLEAGSESGKTTGFFAQMVALSGNVDGAGQHTEASFRDSVAAHRNGIAWLDDMTEMATGKVVDIIRQATSEGNRGKKNMDNKNTDRIALLCPIMVSGEGSGTMLSEKAMRDRSVRLQFSSPKGRKSLHDPDRPQWDDVVALQNRYGGHAAGLSSVAGTLVARVLSEAPRLASLPSLRPSGAGRHADKMAILRMGARILDAVLGDEGSTHALRVDSWVAAQVDSGAANLAVNEIIPWALRSHGGGVPTGPNGWPPAYYNERTKTVWVSISRLADAWHGRHNLTARERQLGGEDAVRTELKAVGADTSGKVREVDHVDGKAVGRRYVEIPAEWTERLLTAAGSEAPQN